MRQFCGSPKPKNKALVRSDINLGYFVFFFLSSWLSCNIYKSMQGSWDILQKYPVPDCDIWFIKFSCDFHYTSIAIGRYHIILFLYFSFICKGCQYAIIYWAMIVTSTTSFLAGKYLSSHIFFSSYAVVLLNKMYRLD